MGYPRSKIEAALSLLQGGLSIAKTAKQCKVGVNTVIRWRDAEHAGLDDAEDNPMAGPIHARSQQPGIAVPEAPADGSAATTSVTVQTIRTPAPGDSPLHQPQTLADFEDDCPWFVYRQDAQTHDWAKLPRTWTLRPYEADIEAEYAELCPGRFKAVPAPDGRRPLERFEQTMRIGVAALPPPQTWAERGPRAESPPAYDAPPTFADRQADRDRQDRQDRDAKDRQERIERENRQEAIDRQARVDRQTAQDRADDLARIAKQASDANWDRIMALATPIVSGIGTALIARMTAPPAQTTNDRFADLALSLAQSKTQQPPPDTATELARMAMTQESMRMMRQMRKDAAEEDATDPKDELMMGAATALMPMLPAVAGRLLGVAAPAQLPSPVQPAANPSAQMLAQAVAGMSPADLHAALVAIQNDPMASAKLQQAAAMGEDPAPAAPAAGPRKAVRAV